MRSLDPDVEGIQKLRFGDMKRNNLVNADESVKTAEALIRGAFDMLPLVNGAAMHRFTINATADDWEIIFEPANADGEPFSE